jgi:hypothetical protein
MTYSDKVTINGVKAGVYPSEVHIRALEEPIMRLHSKDRNLAMAANIGLVWKSLTVDKPIRLQQ